MLVSSSSVDLQVMEYRSSDSVCTGQRGFRLCTVSGVHLYCSTEFLFYRSTGLSVPSQWGVPLYRATGLFVLGQRGFLCIAQRGLFVLDAQVSKSFPKSVLAQYPSDER